MSGSGVRAEIRAAPSPRVANFAMDLAANLAMDLTAGPFRPIG
ncbi:MULTISPECIES: hypothetical protein [unclassified Streptomyces]